MVGLVIAALALLALQVQRGRGRSSLASGLSCLTRALPVVTSERSAAKTGLPEPRVPSPAVVFLQSVVLTNDGKAAVEVNCGEQSTQQLSPGDTVRFTVNDDVPVVLTDGHQRRCLYVGPRVPSGLGGLQPDGSQVIRTSDADSC